MERGSDGDRARRLRRRAGGDGGGGARGPVRQRRVGGRRQGVGRGRDDAPAAPNGRRRRRRRGGAAAAVDRSGVDVAARLGRQPVRLQLVPHLLLDSVPHVTAALLYLHSQRPSESSFFILFALSSIV